MRIDSDPTLIAAAGLNKRQTGSAAINGAAKSASRGVDSVSFSRYVIRSRADIRAESAQPGAQKLTLSAQNPTTKTASTASPSPAESATQKQSINTDKLTTDLVRRVYGQKDLDAVAAAWGASRGDRSYNTIADANSDGVVNFDDQNFIITNWGQPVPDAVPLPEPDLSGPFAQAHIDAAKERFGAKVGEERYLQDADANGDGVIDFNDITHVITNWGQPRNPPSGA